MLHIIQTSPYQHAELTSCLKVFDVENDVLLLIQDAVLAGQESYQIDDKNLNTLLSKAKLFILESDLKMRTKSDTVLKANGITINYDGFVKLTVDHKQIQTWL